MPVKICACTLDSLGEVRELMRQTFCGRDFVPGPQAPFYIAYDVCDPDFRPEQYRFRRLRGRVVSALKVFVRRLDRAGGVIPVTLIGAVCTREGLRGRALIKPVIEDSLAYSRSLGAEAELIVTPRPNYYQRHGFRAFPTVLYEGRIPEREEDKARIEPLQRDDAGWMTELFNQSAFAYGPIVRSEQYTGRWILEMRLASGENLGLKLLRRGKPVAFMIAAIKDDPVRVYEAVSRSRSGVEEATLLSFLGRFSRSRFVCSFPDAHPLIGFLRQAGARLKRTVENRLMYYPLGPSFPAPGEEFFFSQLDNV